MTDDAPWPPEWVGDLVRDHHDRIAEDPKPYLSVVDTIWMAYERGFNDGVTCTDYLLDLLGQVTGYARGLEHELGQGEYPATQVEHAEREIARLRHLRNDWEQEES